jgi:predicted transcriptional regulator
MPQIVKLATQAEIAILETVRDRKQVDYYHLRKIYNLSDQEIRTARSFLLNNGFIQKGKNFRRAIWITEKGYKILETREYTNI